MRYKKGYVKKVVTVMLKNIGKHERLKKVVCPNCLEVEPLAVDWDYQKCHKCHHYIYDNRGLI